MQHNFSRVAHGYNQNQQPRAALIEPYHAEQTISI